jgi:peroxiredoxin
MSFRPSPEGHAAFGGDDRVEWEAMLRSLHDQLNALANDLGVPGEVTELITREIAQDAGDSAPGLGVGDVAPDFELPNATGRRVRLTSLLSRGPVIVSFYRGEWCPYCNLALRAWRDQLDAVASAGAQFVAVTPQRPSNALSLSAKHALAFPVLSDLDQEVVRAYRLRYQISAALKELYASAFGVDLSVHNADGSWTLTVPATFVVDTDQTLAYAYANVDWRQRAEPADVLRAIRKTATAG